MSDRGLVVGELRGYRQFDLIGGALYPVVHASAGPWDGELERAQCVRDEEHEAPVRGCTCGLYAVYQPGSATVALGTANAVVAARGRVVLGDRGFRAQAARIEAVALPALLLSPRAARRARRDLARAYPSTRVYRSTRRMLRDHPPHDVSALGVNPPRDRSRQYRAAAVLLWALFVVAGYSLVFLPHDPVAAALRNAWPLLIAVLVGFQAALVWLFSRLMALQGPPRNEPPEP